MLDSLPAVQYALTSIPTIVWSSLAGAVVSALITLATVWMTNRGNTKRLDRQLEAEQLRLTAQLASEASRQEQRLMHEATQKDADRISVLRKDVYLRLPLEISDALENLVNLPLRDTDKDGVGPGVSGYARIAAQLSVLAQEDTVDAVMNLSEELHKTWFETLTRAQSIQALRRKVTECRSRLETVDHESERLISRLEQLSGAKNYGALDDISRMFTQSQNDSAALLSDIERLQSDIRPMILAEHGKFLDLMPSLSGLVARAMRMVRRDIGLNKGLDIFERNFVARWDRIYRELATFSERVRARAPNKEGGGN